MSTILQQYRPISFFHLLWDRIFLASADTNFLIHSKQKLLVFIWLSYNWKDGPRVESKAKVEGNGWS